MCSGYYRYSAGFDAKLPDTDDFQGRLVHPQFWPDDLDVAGKDGGRRRLGRDGDDARPGARRDSARHVTMLQRSPTYVVARPDVDKLANRLRKVLPDKTAYAVTRWKNVTCSSSSTSGRAPSRRR